MKIHTTVVTSEQFADWNGKPAHRVDLKTKNSKKAGADLHLYFEDGSPLKGIKAGAVVHIETQRPKKQK